MPKYFDIHSHLDFPDYKPDFEAVISRLSENDIGTITVGTDLESAKRAVALADAYKNVWACIGVHPADNHAEMWNEEEYEKLVAHPKVVAIGECGLDYFRPPFDEVTKTIDEAKFEIEKRRQKELFEKQIQFAIKHKKVLMIHCREAYVDTYKILAYYKKDNPDLKIHLHFYAGDLETTKKFLELDATFSFTGVITFAKQYDEVIKFLPLEKIMSETDSPFVAPAPHRGQRNEPAYVIEVVKRLAEIRGEDLEKVKTQILLNVKNIFEI